MEWFCHISNIWILLLVIPILSHFFFVSVFSVAQMNKMDQAFKHTYTTFYHIIVGSVNDLLVMRICIIEISTLTVSLLLCY